MANSSGLFDDGYTFVQNKMPFRNVARVLARKNGFRKLNALFDTLINGDVGDTAQKAYARVQHDPQDDGGQRVIEQVDVINRATDANDEAALREIIVDVARAPNYPADASGNGGGAFNPGNSNPVFGPAAAVVNNGDSYANYTFTVVDGVITAVDSSQAFASDSHTATGGEATANEITIDTGIDTDEAFSALVVDIVRSGASVKDDAVVVDNEDGTFTIQEDSNYAVTAGDVVNWAAAR